MSHSRGHFLETTRQRWGSEAGSMGRRSVADRPLVGVRVLELAVGIAGPYGGKLLADLGAEVVKAEAPEGDVSRQRGPFRGGAADPESSGFFLYLNAGKRGITLDLDG